MCGILSLIYKVAHQVVYGLRLISTCRKCRPKTRWNLLFVLLLSDYRGYVTCWFLLRQCSFLFQRDRHRKPKHDGLQCTFITHPLQCKCIQLNILWLFLIVFLMCKLSTACVKQAEHFRVSPKASFTYYKNIQSVAVNGNLLFSLPPQFDNISIRLDGVFTFFESCHIGVVVFLLILQNTQTSFTFSHIVPEGLPCR